MSGLAGEDRLVLRELVDTYALAADQRDRELFGRLWVRDAVLRVRWPDGAPEKVFRGADRIAVVVDGLHRYVSTLHLVANQVLRPVAGDEVAGEVYCHAHHLTETAAGLGDRVLYIRYSDRYRRTAPGWRFGARTVDVLWGEVRAVLRPAAPATSSLGE